MKGSSAITLAVLVFLWLGVLTLISSNKKLGNVTVQETPLLQNLSSTGMHSLACVLRRRGKKGKSIGERRGSSAWAETGRVEEERWRQEGSDSGGVREKRGGTDELEKQGRDGRKGRDGKGGKERGAEKIRETRREVREKTRVN